MKILILLSCVAAVISQQCFSQDDGNPDQKTYASLYAGQQGFSLSLLNAINKLMPNENIFFSPYSTYHALLIAYFMSGKQTESYLKKVLKLVQNEEKKDVYNAYKLDKYMTQVLAHKNKDYEFSNANKIYVSNQVPVRECIKNYFPEELELTDFKSQSEAARSNINDWVSNQTHAMIKDLLPPGSVDSTTELVLVNAAYFKGMWENKFDPDQTKQEVFYVNPNKQIMVDMMHVEGSFKHDVSESLAAHILELPYVGSTISMYILLPPFVKDSVETTLKNLTLENFKSVIESENLISKTVQVALPKFSLETTIELVPILESLGVGNLFKSDADFSTLTTKKVGVNEAVHKARLDINEHGSTAAAATAIFGWRMMTEEEPAVRFIANRPFLFVIYNKKTRTVLFTGIFKNAPH